jgi:hypothetical protein
MPALWLEHSIVDVRRIEELLKKVKIEIELKKIEELPKRIQELPKQKSRCFFPQGTKFDLK